MTPEEFRHHAHGLVDWMADYLATVGERRIAPLVEPGDVRRMLPREAPARGEPFERIAADFRDVIVPGMTHWNHPGWFAYFPANTSPPSILAEMLTATIGAQCMSWATSPAATELEQVVMEWLRRMLDVPPEFTGVIQDTSSTATLVAVLTARERATNHLTGARGLSGGAPRLTAYASVEAHSSVAKAVKLAGIGLENLRLVPVDSTWALDPARLAALMAADVADGCIPACVIATVGTTSSTGLDPIRAIGEICRQHGAWLHVDAAYAGSAAILPECRYVLDGIELADSLVFNPHKWLLTNFDCSAYFVRDVDLLRRTFQTSPEYLKTTHDPEVANFRDWGIQLGRRFRALKLWFVLRSYGVDGLQAMLRRHIALAAEFRGWVEAEPGFEVAAPSPLGLVCFRYAPGGPSDVSLDARNRAMLQRVNADGSVHLTHTVLAGRYTLRMAIGQWQTARADVARAWKLIRAAAVAEAPPGEVPS
ncbi:MAG: aminotransferase class V-fold PLP-dependent enzyme [Gemmatimonadales bacterium]|nr:aminotransferase class V-fold PLP-dependent enzyme [Gemmatimonadales bacterium]